MKNTKKIRIESAGRLHFGLIDLNGSLGRTDGGIGVALKKPEIIVDAEFIENSNASGIEIIGTKRTCEISDAVNKLNNLVNLNQKFNTNIKIIIKNNIPSHSGLGSTTQTLLAVSKAVTELNGISLNARELSNIIGRGGTSGIGTGVFESGGFILDGGHTFGSGKQKNTFIPSSISPASPAPILARYNLPNDWFFVVVIPAVKSKIYGQKEVNIFQKYCPIPESDVEKLSRLILIKILPSIVEKDIDSFGSGLSQMQNISFKKIEVSLQDEIVTGLIYNLNKNSYGAGMSSFGAAVYAVAKGRKHADEIAGCVNEFLAGKVNFKTIITAADNSGAKICINEK